MMMLYVIVYFGDAAGKCARLVKLSGPNINIAYKPDGEHIAVVNTVCLVVRVGDFWDCYLF